MTDRMTSANSLHPSEGHPMSTTTSSRASEAELLPCPLCGASFRMAQEPHDTPYVGGMFYLFHEYGPIDSAARRCCLDVNRHFDTAEEAHTAWNTRALAASPVQAKRPEPAVSAEDIAMLAEAILWEREFGHSGMVGVLQRIHEHLSTPDRTEELDKEVERLREALEPSGDTKAAYSGEFFEEIDLTNPDYDEDDEDSEETLHIRVPVQWATVKEIMRAIRARAALAKNGA